jgi:uncharacterized protein affecting Mg2+/Co2+ transport
VWAYEVTVTNDSDRKLKLLTRHFIISDASGGIEEVRGSV